MSRSWKSDIEEEHEVESEGEDPAYTSIIDYHIAVGKSGACAAIVRDGVDVDVFVQLNSYDMPVVNEIREDTLDGVPWLRIDASDNEDFDMKQLFPRINAFVDQHHSPDGTSSIYFCCEAGVSQSATAACAYLMKKHAISCEVALSILSRNRKCAKPNPGFRRQLEEYETELRSTLVTYRPMCQSDGWFIDGMLYDVTEDSERNAIVHQF